MMNKNLLAGFLIAAATLVSALSPTPALAQRYYGYANYQPMQFNQQLANQQAYQQQMYQQPNYQQQPVYQQPMAYQQPTATPYTPNINGVPLDPNTPRSGLNSFGFDGGGNAYNNLTQPQYERFFDGYGHPNLPANMSIPQNGGYGYIPNNGYVNPYQYR